MSSSTATGQCPDLNLECRYGNKTSPILPVIAPAARFVPIAERHNVGKVLLFLKLPKDGVPQIVAGQPKGSRKSNPPPVVIVPRFTVAKSIDRCNCGNAGKWEKKVFWLGHVCNNKSHPTARKVLQGLDQQAH
jgi:hypothetical protein